ncbi:MAG: phytanoyl-CoA dioxygenase family protein [Gemmatimonadetes bacterium]|jgi:ectoine hydroxylase-related dioxygenase (phytanoyl-CoA dioxygenase family)|nr:phytanoyl-CoA dioxygenase family protein [Gemmatimonadota bacterium]MBT5056791.1 phytanoyl-CoA dioxygenase family protein [Gemmatimonadota bacterium]MBT5143500.1 phytanoyl-CoA dioxygenase family protein [Gemmatimonadota bacterium]MBT5590191.1 phytanoyl-CoA dioxygenase family protein [Gemmatimonadota bacterium]MBT5963654.1 phytanoyl-CoA dioxygenase family protein [Gemmatimonadota bacterium]
MSEITPERAHYERDGYAIYRGVIDAGLVAEASDHVDWLLANNPGLRPEQLHNNLMTNDPFWVRLVADDRLLDIAQQYVGPDIALFASHYISKPPGDGQPVLWHQDGSYWPLEPMEVVTLWLAVDDSDAENGCMRVLPGTQHTELQEMQKNTEVENVLGSSIDPAKITPGDATDIDLAAGDVSVHHANIIHGSNANTSDRRRCGLTIRYIPATTRILTNQQWPSAFLLRGKAVDSVNDYLSWPTYQSGEHMPFDGCQDWPPTH